MDGGSDLPELTPDGGWDEPRDAADDAHAGLLHAVGALALGTLDDEEAAQVRAHLETCTECRAVYDELAGLPALLALVPVAEATDGPPVPDAAMLDRLLAATSAERRRERFRRYGIAATAAMAAAAAAVAIVMIFDSPADRAPIADPTPTISAELLTARDAASGISAKVSLRSVAWGTVVDLQLRGVEPGYICSLVAVDRDGRRETASTWTVPAGGYPDGGSGALSIGGATGFDRGAIVRFEVVEDTGALLLTIPA